MRVTTIVSLGASAVLGIGALFAAKFWLPDSEKDKVVQTAPVVVAARPIEFGTKLDEKNLAVVQLPVEAAPAGSYRTIKEVIAMDGGAPVALTALAPREAILPAKLSGAGARASVAAMITPGMRAYTIQVGDVNGGGGHVLPGDRVDVLLARAMPGGQEQQNLESDVVLQNVRILGINLNADQTTTAKANPKNATLEVTVEDAARLSIASQVGTLSLALRRTGAAEVEPVRAVRVSDLRPYGSPPSFQPVRRAVSDAPPPPPPVAPRPKTGGLVVVNGTQRATTTSGAGA
ncbi:MAG TPA: Flp pilus assembly protein CpaB [Caulobacteraceae bacterium]|nr:Flp pilus assembly protein CpaB [Caulobacteraceae bacterium]